MRYKHYVGPKNPIANVETDAPSRPIAERERLAKKTVKRRKTDKDKQIIEGWRNDPRMVFLGVRQNLTLANPGRDLTAKEREEWERNIAQYQIYSYPKDYENRP